MPASLRSDSYSHRRNGPFTSPEYAARTGGAGVGTRVWVEVEPQWGVPGVGATGESSGTHLPATTKSVTAKSRGMAGRHGLESGSTPAKSAGFVEPTGHRLCH